MQPHLPQLADEEDEHEPEERGCSSRAHQNDYLNVWPSFIPWKDRDCHNKEKTKKERLFIKGSWIIVWTEMCPESYTEKDL